MKRLIPVIFAEMVTALVPPTALLAQSAATPQSQNQTAQSAQAGQQGPSYKDTVKWIQDNIKLAGTPGSSTQQELHPTLDRTETVTDTLSGTSYEVNIDGCNSLTFILTQTENASGGISSVTTFHIKVPFESILGFFTENKDQPHVGIVVKAGSGSIGSDTTMTDKDGTTISKDPPTPISAKNAPIALVSAEIDESGVSPYVPIGYSKSGSEDAAPHMTAALSHLVDICKNHPEQAPKSLF